MLSPVAKPWSGVTRGWRLYRTADTLEHGIHSDAVDGANPTPGIITVIVTIPDETDLKSGHVAHRVATLLAEHGPSEWKDVEKVCLDAMDALAEGHGLGRRHHHHVAAAHRGQFSAHPSHVVDDLFAEYLLTGNVALHDAGGAVEVDDGRRKYTAYAQPGHAEESKRILQQFPQHFQIVAMPLFDALEGKILVV